MQHFLIHWGYVALFVTTLVASFGIPVGSELVIAYGGALASGQVLSGTSHHFSLGLVILIALLGEIAGSLLGYAFGRFGGRPIVDRVGRYVLLTHRDLDRVEGFLERHGEGFVLLGRLIPLLRSFVAIVAGLAEMSIARFAAFTLIASAVFCAALASIGYALGASYHAAVHAFSEVGYVAAALAVLAVLVAIAHRVKVLREERALERRAGSERA